MLTFEQIKELIELVGRHGLSGLEVERSGFRLKISGLQAAPQSGTAWVQTLPAVPAIPPMTPISGAPLPATSLVLTVPPAAAEPAAAFAQSSPANSGAAATSGATAAAEATPPAHTINSPIVGTFYRSPSPEAAPFVEVGSRVRRGQVVCIIEAMKLMNEIESEYDGTITEIYPQNAQAVAYNDPLFGVKVSS